MGGVSTRVLQALDFNEPHNSRIVERYVRRPDKNGCVLLEALARENTWCVTCQQVHERHMDRGGPFRFICSGGRLPPGLVRKEWQSSRQLVVQALSNTDPVRIWWSRGMRLLVAIRTHIHLQTYIRCPPPA